MKHENLVLSNEFIKVEHHRKRFGKLTFGAFHQPFVRAHDEGLITGEKRHLSKSVTVVIRRMQANPRSPSLSYLKFHKTMKISQNNVFT